MLTSTSKVGLDWGRHNVEVSEVSTDMAAAHDFNRANKFVFLRQPMLAMLTGVSSS